MSEENRPPEVTGTKTEAANVMSETTAAPQAPTTGTPVEAPKKKSNRAMWIILAVLILIVVCPCCFIAATSASIFNAVGEAARTGKIDYSSDFSTTTTVTPKAGKAVKGSAEWKLEVASYSTSISTISRSVASGLTGFGTFVQAKSDYTAWTSSDEAYVDSQIAVIKKGYTDAQTLTVPAGMEHIHTSILNAMKLYSDAMTKFKSAVNTDSSADMNAALQLIEKANAETQKATTQLTQFRSENGL